MKKPSDRAMELVRMEGSRSLAAIQSAGLSALIEWADEQWEKQQPSADVADMIADVQQPGEGVMAICACDKPLSEEKRKEIAEEREMIHGKICPVCKERTLISHDGHIYHCPTKINIWKT